MKLAFRSEVFSSKYGKKPHLFSRHDTTTKSFKPCCLKWSFCWTPTPEGLWDSSAGMDYLIRLQRLDQEGWVVSLSFPVWKLLLSMVPNHFHFRLALWFGLSLWLHQALCYKCMVLPTIKVFPTCFRHLKQDLNCRLKFLPTCWRNSPQ